MAIYHCTTKTINRSSGRTAVASMAYRAGDKLTAE
ncbi:mobilization protein, partial [Acinetobacter schindleri]